MARPSEFDTLVAVFRRVRYSGCERFDFFRNGGRFLFEPAWSHFFFIVQCLPRVDSLECLPKLLKTLFYGQFGAFLPTRIPYLTNSANTFPTCTTL